MSKLFVTLAALGALATPAWAMPLGPDAARCVPGTGANALLVSVSGFKSRRGTLRVQLYGSNPSDFLAKGKKLHRVDLPISSGTMEVCVPLARPGRYAIAVRHDANMDRKTGLNDGGGFSRNPRLSLAGRPTHKDVALNVPAGVHRVPVVLQYRSGLSVKPLKTRT